MIKQEKIERWFKETYDNFREGLQRLQGNPVNNPSAFIAVSGHMDLIMIWDNTGKRLPKGDYLAALNAMEIAAKTRPPEIRDNWMQEIGIIRERGKDYFGVEALVA